MEKLNINSFFYGWTIVKSIGRGGYGEVYEIQRSSLGETEKAALKVLHIPNDPTVIQDMRSEGYDDESIKQRMKADLRSFSNEYKSMRNLVHANIVNCDDMQYEADENGLGYTVYIKMELLTPLVEELKGTYDPNAVASKLGKDICKALDLCEERNIVHRDIKPQNLFVDSYGNYKLGDFGIARQMDHTTHATKTGTYKYMAPEVYRGEKYYHEVDIYSLGLVMYWILNRRRLPFVPLPPSTPDYAQEEEAKNRRLRGDRLPEPADGSKGLKRIVLKSCEADRNKRYKNASEMLTDLEALDAAGSYKSSTSSVFADRDHSPTDSTDFTGDESTNGFQTDGQYNHSYAQRLSDHSQREYPDNDSTLGNQWDDSNKTASVPVYSNRRNASDKIESVDETVGSPTTGNRAASTKTPEHREAPEFKSTPPKSKSQRVISTLCGVVFWLSAILFGLSVIAILIFGLSNESSFSNIDFLGITGIAGLTVMAAIFVLVPIIAIKYRKKWSLGLQVFIALALIAVIIIQIQYNNKNSSITNANGNKVEFTEVTNDYGTVYEDVAVISDSDDVDWMIEKINTEPTTSENLTLDTLGEYYSQPIFYYYLLKSCKIVTPQIDSDDVTVPYLFDVSISGKTISIEDNFDLTAKKINGLDRSKSYNILCESAGYIIDDSDWGSKLRLDDILDE